MDSHVRHMFSHNIATGIVAPTPSTPKCTTQPQMERKEARFHVISSCRAAIFPVCNASRAGCGQSSQSHGIASLCYWNCCSKSHHGIFHNNQRYSQYSVIPRVVSRSCCQAAIFRVRNGSRCGSGQSSQSDGIASLCCWNHCSNGLHGIFHSSLRYSQYAVNPRVASRSYCQAAIFPVGHDSRNVNG
jgi:hypothetical protein